MLSSKLPTIAALAFGLALSAAVSIAAAQETGKPAGKPNTGMMGGRGGGMMGMMSGVDPAQMNRMVENCNRMMESMMQNVPAAPSTQAPEKKG